LIDWSLTPTLAVCQLYISWLMLYIEFDNIVMYLWRDA